MVYCYFVRLWREDSVSFRYMFPHWCGSFHWSAHVTVSEVYGAVIFLWVVSESVVHVTSASIQHLHSTSILQSSIVTSSDNPLFINSFMASGFWCPNPLCNRRMHLLRGFWVAVLACLSAVLSLYRCSSNRPFLRICFLFRIVHSLPWNWTDTTVRKKPSNSEKSC